MESIKELLYEPKNGYDRITPVQEAEMEAYSERYKHFLDAAKTEREAVTEMVRQAEAAGFRAYNGCEPIAAGDKLYRVNQNKAVTFVVVGAETLDKGARISAAHIDNPRLDLKPNPLYQDSEMALFQTHYYGGIKKYQWPTIPLALHGVVVRQDGTTVNVCIGEDPSDPVLYITDLLIHLSGEQMKATLAEGIKGEALNVLLGTKPLAGEEGDRVKLAVLKLLHEKYGICEYDFRCAELTMTPAGPARDAGLDRSLIGAFGHDDRVCAYAAFEPMLTLGTPKYTAVCVLADKEEVGSMGISGMQSAAFDTLMEDLCDAQGVKVRRCFEHSICLSADVVNAYDPNYPEPTDRLNNAKVNYGMGICKYTGSRGKGGSSDASAELMGKVRAMLDGAGVIWQTAELGKVDAGGGGTVAQYMANRNIETVDAGVPVLSMHAPIELVAKLDCYETMLGMRALYNS